MRAMESVDVCIQGRGAVGMSLALAFCSQGLAVALPGTDAATAQPDIRAYALNAASRALLQRLRVWDQLPADAVTPVLDMHVAGDAADAAIDFSAWTQGLEALAWIVDAGELDAALRTALRLAPHLVAQAPERAALTVHAEGRDSAAREALGVRFERHDYGQRALAARLVGTQPHHGVARQWFRSPDVLALLPMDRPEAGRGLALVWSLPQSQAEALARAPAEAFEAALAEATGGEPGALRLVSERASWPLAVARAEPVCGAGWALVGDAAHIVHPLAGQGLNLGLGDVATLARVIAEREPWRALGDEILLRRYARERAFATRTMAGLTDGLVHLFASRAPLVKELRNRGLNLLNLLSPLKRALTHRAMDA